MSWLELGVRRDGPEGGWVDWLVLEMAERGFRSAESSVTQRGR